MKLPEKCSGCGADLIEPRSVTQVVFGELSSNGSRDENGDYYAETEYAADNLLEVYWYCLECDTQIGEELLEPSGYTHLDKGR